MKSLRILLFEQIVPVDRGAGVTSRPLVGEEMGATAFCDGITSFAPATGIPLHTHNVDESVTLLEGEGEFQSGDIVQSVKPYDTVFVPAGTVHRFRNRGKGTMRILWVYGGVHVTRTFTETGETVDQLSEADRAGRREG